MAGPVELLIGGYDAPEEPAFDRDGDLYVGDSFVSAIVKVPPDGQGSDFFNTGGIPAGLAFHPDGNPWVADEGDQLHGILRVSADGKRSEIVVNAYQGAPPNGANALVFDANGVLSFSDPRNGPGGFYRRCRVRGRDFLDRGRGFGTRLGLGRAALRGQHVAAFRDFHRRAEPPRLVMKRGGTRNKHGGASARRRRFVRGDP